MHHEYYPSKETVHQNLISAFKNIYDPEIPVNIYDLGLIYRIDLIPIEAGWKVEIEMTLTSVGCPVGESLVEMVHNASCIVEAVEESYVTLTFDPPWNDTRMSEEAKLILGML